MSSMADVGCVTRDRPSGLNLYLCLFTNKSSSLNVVNRVNYWRGGSGTVYSEPWIYVSYSDTRNAKQMARRSSVHSLGRL